jgi:hypothetical protein
LGKKETGRENIYTIQHVKQSPVEGLGLFNRPINTAQICLTDSAELSNTIFPFPVTEHKHSQLKCRRELYSSQQYPENVQNDTRPLESYGTAGETLNSRRSVAEGVRSSGMLRHVL